tara:strand:+ start:854 stop:964 length:111 start_codon:yes stop_codon:yes gene_type:complete
MDKILRELLSRGFITQEQHDVISQEWEWCGIRRHEE